MVRELTATGLSEDGHDADDDESLAANTSEMEDKTVALGALAEYATTLRGDFAPFVAQIMPIALDALSVRESYEVREVSWTHSQARVRIRLTSIRLLRCKSLALSAQTTRNRH